MRLEFSLLTHGFFKALLFLGAGFVIHAMSDEQDMRKMGGLSSEIRLTYILMLVGSLSLAGIGIPGTSIVFAGFHSKDLILEAAWAPSYMVWGSGVLAWHCGCVYDGVLFVASFVDDFNGPTRADEKVLAHVHEVSAGDDGAVDNFGVRCDFCWILLQGTLAGEGYLEDFWRGSIVVGAGHDND